MLELTVFNSEHRTDRTNCLSCLVAMYVIALTPCTGKICSGIYMLLLIIVNSSLSTSHRLLSISRFDPSDVLHPTPLCQMAKVTFDFEFGSRGIVKPV